VSPWITSGDPMTVVADLIATAALEAGPHIACAVYAVRLTLSRCPDASLRLLALRIVSGGSA